MSENSNSSNPTPNSNLEIIKQNLIQKEQILINKIYTGANLNNLNQIDLIGGIDISYPKNEQNNPTICYSIFSRSEDKIIISEAELVSKENNENQSAHTETALEPEIPYIAGFLGHKEANIMTPFIKKIHQKFPNKIPQIILVDGNGILHSRRFGSACHIHKILNIPTIGVGKNLLHVENITPKPKDINYKEKISKELLNFGDYFVYSEMQPSNREIVAVLRSTQRESKYAIKNDNSCRPIFVSIGGGVENLKLAVEIVLSCSKFKIPEPIRDADLKGRQLLRDLGY